MCSDGRAPNMERTMCDDKAMAGMSSLAVAGFGTVLAVLLVTCLATCCIVLRAWRVRWAQRQAAEEKAEIADMIGIAVSRHMAIVTQKVSAANLCGEQSQLSPLQPTPLCADLEQQLYAINDELSMSPRVIDDEPSCVADPPSLSPLWPPPLSTCAPRPQVPKITSLSPPCSPSPDGGSASTSALRGLSGVGGASSELPPCILPAAHRGLHSVEQRFGWLLPETEDISSLRAGLCELPLDPLEFEHWEGCLPPQVLDSDSLEADMLPEPTNFLGLKVSGVDQDRSMLEYAGYDEAAEPEFSTMEVETSVLIEDGQLMPIASQDCKAALSIRVPLSWNISKPQLLDEGGEFSDSDCVPPAPTEPPRPVVRTTGLGAAGRFRSAESYRLPPEPVVASATELLDPFLMLPSPVVANAAELLEPHESSSRDCAVQTVAADARVGNASWLASLVGCPGNCLETPGPPRSSDCLATVGVLASRGPEPALDSPLSPSPRAPRVDRASDSIAPSYAPDEDCIVALARRDKAAGVSAASPGLVVVYKL